MGQSKNFTKIFTSSENNLSSGEYLKRYLAFLIHHPGTLPTVDEVRELPSYKMFHQLIYEIMGLVRFYGLAPKASLQEIRRILSEDLKRERELQKKRQESLLQMALMLAMIWPFVLIAQVMLEVHVDALYFGAMLLLQTLGAGIFLVFYQQGYVRFFSGIKEFAAALYTLRGLGRCSLARKKVLEMAKVADVLAEHQQTHFQALRDGLMQTLELWGEGGHAPGEDLQDLCDELWSVHEERMELFDKYSYSLRLLALAGFFMPSLFVFMFGLFTAVIGQDILAL